MTDDGRGLAPGSLVGGRYRLGQLLGEGGMGVVHAAVDESTGDEVAVKLLAHEHASAELAERFVREGAAARRIDHPGVVPVMDQGAHHGRPFLVMPRLKGQSLQQLLAAQAPLPLQRVRSLGAQLAAAVAAAHAGGIIHRDLKPQNVWIEARPDGSEAARVLDFGIAKLLEGARTLTASDQVLGTPSYMAPEQLQSAKRVSARADVYALGAILYEMLTGAPPFRAPTRTELVLAVLNDPPQPIATHRSDVPATMAQAIEHALAKTPSERLASAALLARALARPAS